MSRAQNLIDAAWNRYEYLRLHDYPLEHQEAAAEELFLLMALRQSAELEVEAWVEYFRPFLDELKRHFVDLAERLKSVLKNVSASQRRPTPPFSEHPSKLTRLQVKSKAMPKGMRAPSVGFANPATIRR